MSARLTVWMCGRCGSLWRLPADLAKLQARVVSCPACARRGFPVPAVEERS